MEGNLLRPDPGTGGKDYFSSFTESSERAVSAKKSGDEARKRAYTNEFSVETPRSGKGGGIESYQ